MNNSVIKKKGGVVFFNSEALPSKRTVIKRLGVKQNSFAGNMISRMYDYYFTGAVNISKEYSMYYNKEFETVIDYMEQHHNISHQEAVYMSKGNYSTKNCSQDNIDFSITSLLIDEDFKLEFSKAVGGIIDEDPNWLYYE